MTANGTAGGSMTPLAGLLALLNKAGVLCRRIFLGGLFIVAAGIVAVATTFLGVILAIAAVLLRFSGRRGRMASPAGSASAKGAETSNPVTLEARQTGEGWTVE